MRKADSSRRTNSSNAPYVGLSSRVVARITGLIIAGATVSVVLLGASVEGSGGPAFQAADTTVRGFSESVQTRSAPTKTRGPKATASALPLPTPVSTTPTPLPTPVPTPVPPTPSGFDSGALANLFLNPTFEGGFIAGTTQGTHDKLNNLNAWTPALGSSFTVASRIVSNPNTSENIMSYGHPGWWDQPSGSVLPAYLPANGSQLRWKWATSGTFSWYVRYVDLNNWVRVRSEGTTLYLEKSIAGAFTIVNTQAITALVNGTFYWFRGTVVGTTYTFGLFADSSVSVGVQNGANVTGTISNSAVEFGKSAIGMSGSSSLQFGGVEASTANAVVFTSCPRPTPGWFSGDDEWGYGIATAVSKADSYSPTHSLSIYGAPTAGPYDYGYWAYVPVNLVQGTTYVMSARQKLIGLTGGGARLADHDIAHVSPLRTGTHDWEPEAFTFVESLNIPEATPYVIQYGTGESLWDDLVIAIVGVGSLTISDRITA